MNNKLKQVAMGAAKKAGRELLLRFKNFNRNKIQMKSAHEILTKADLASEKIIIGEIRKNFPGHRILSEEAGVVKTKKSPLPPFVKGGKNNGYLWIIDPLDGTTNFSIHNPLWSISISLAYKNEIILGIIYAPFLGELFAARKGKGVTLNGKKIRVSKIKGAKALHTFCHGRGNKHIEKALAYLSRQKLDGFDCRQLGSAAIELGFIAAGRTESIMIPGVNSWDVAAGALIVREAGGRVTDFAGEEWNLKSKDILASNGVVHKELLRVIGMF